MRRGRAAIQRYKLSDPAREGPRLQPEREGRVRCGAWLGSAIMSHPFFGPQAREQCQSVPKQQLRPQQSKLCLSLATVWLLPSR